MTPFDGRKSKRLSYEIVGDMRFFGYYIGNQTILSGTKWGVGYNIEIIFEKSDAIGNIFALELFRNKGIKGDRQNNSEELDTTLSSSELIGEYIESNLIMDFILNLEEGIKEVVLNDLLNEL